MEKNHLIEKDQFSEYISIDTHGYYPAYLSEYIEKDSKTERDKEIYRRILTLFGYSFVKGKLNPNKFYQVYSLKLVEIHRCYKSYMDKILLWPVFKPFKDEDGNEVIRLNYSAAKTRTDGKPGACFRYLFSDNWVRAFRERDTIRVDFNLRVRARPRKTLKQNVEEHLQMEQELDAALAHVDASIREYEPNTEAGISNLSENQKVAVDDVFKKRARITRSERVGKICSSVSCLPDWVRSGGNAKLRGETVVEMDLKSHHLRLIADNKEVFFGKNTEEHEAFVALFSDTETNTDDAYLNLKTAISNYDPIAGETIYNMNRKQIKEFFQIMISGKCPKVYKNLRFAFRKLFPTLYGAFKKIRAAGNTVNGLLQKLEAKKVDEFVLACKAQNIPVITIFDSFLLRSSDVDFATAYFGDDRISVKQPKMPPERVENPNVAPQKRLKKPRVGMTDRFFSYLAVA